MKQITLIISFILIVMKTIPSNAQQWPDSSLYPFESKYIELPEGKMHYVDEGRGETILFVHGTPTWSFLYRDFIKALSENHRCIGIDHLGFGLSEKPADFPGTPAAHAENLGLFIDKLNLRDITLVVHDFGGPIGLASALEKPEKIKRIVLFNTWLWATKNNEGAQKVDKIVNTGPGKFLYLNMNISPKYLLKKGFSDKKHLPKKVHRHYIRPFSKKRSRMSLLNLAKALVGSSDWYRERWEQIDRLADKEWLILWGTKDEFISTEYLSKWKEKWPKARVKEFDAGHFVQEERTIESIREISRFMQ